MATLFQSAGYTHADTAILQPADIFIDFSGEDLRRRLFVSEGINGEALCLRPEFTIPLSLDYLQSRRDLPTNLFAIGPVFRQRADETGEFTQIGIERFGHPDVDVVDAECFALALQALEACGFALPQARIGDVGLVHALFDQMDIPSATRRRLMRALAVGGSIEPILAQSADDQPAPAFAGVLAALEGADKDQAKAFVSDLLSIAGVDKVGGRGADDIATRFLRRASGEAKALTPAAIAMLRAFFALSGEPDLVIEALHRFTAEHGLGMGPAIALLENRAGFIAAQGVDLSLVRFETAFVRSLDYYTGFVFDVPSAIPGKPLVGGGRYDTLMRRLGADTDIPAIGFALWPERLHGALP